MNLRVRVVRCKCAGSHWFADIDDADDPQPDDPFWYRDGCGSQSEALRSACAQLSALTERVEHGASLTRVHEADLVLA
jgi:hypothetical protein